MYLTEWILGVPIWANDYGDIGNWPFVLFWELHQKRGKH